MRRGVLLAFLLPQIKKECSTNTDLGIEENSSSKTYSSQEFKCSEFAYMGMFRSLCFCG